MFVYFYSCVNERFQRLFANLVAVMQIDGAPARWRHRLIGCGRFAIMRGLVGLPLRIKNTRDIANSSSPTGQMIRASSSAKNEISGPRIDCGRSAMKSSK